MTGYLGPQGTYTELAGRKLSEEPLKEYPAFYALFDALKRGDITNAVLPFENSLQGTVTECLDLLYENSGFYISKESSLKIEHKLFIKEGGRLEDIRRVYSHEQALKQCGRFLSGKLPLAGLISVSSTAKGLEMVKSVEDAAIAGGHVQREGLTPLLLEIADEKYNRTRFVLIEKKLNTSSQKILFALGGENRPGGLLEILEVLKNGGLNMSKIESRPVKREIGKYLFFIEIEADILEKRVKNTLEVLKNSYNSFKLLGAY